MTYDELEISVEPDLLLRARRYRGGPKTQVLCIPGLTRNAGDFADFAPKAAATGRDVVTVNLRGRGVSDYDPQYLNYHPETYRDDMLKVLDAVSAETAIFVGTSLGGIVTMLVNAAAPSRVKAAVLNDVGPDLAPGGIARIASYVGKTAGPAKDLEEAAAHIKAINGIAFPDASEDDWLVFAERTFREAEDGWVLDYDLNIARALAELGPAPDLWPAFESLKGTPTLVVRGALSDLLTPPIIEKMRGAHPNFRLAEIPRTGHAPMLTEPAAWEAVSALLDTLD